jgi:hypothetical protein
MVIYRHVCTVLREQMLVEGKVRECIDFQNGSNDLSDLIDLIDSIGSIGSIDSGTSR